MNQTIFVVLFVSSLIGTLVQANSTSFSVQVEDPSAPLVNVTVTALNETHYNFNVSVSGSRWIGFGFSPNGSMAGADAYIFNGTVNDYYIAAAQGSAVLLDEAQGGTDDITDAFFSTENNVTTYSWTRAADTGDSKDYAIVPGANQDYLVAFGGDNQMTISFHSNRKTVKGHTFVVPTFGNQSNVVPAPETPQPSQPETPQPSQPETPQPSQPETSQPQAPLPNSAPAIVTPKSTPATPMSPTTPKSTPATPMSPTTPKSTPATPMSPITPKSTPPNGGSSSGSIIFMSVYAVFVAFFFIFQ